MKKIAEYLKKPRNIYFYLVIMATIVTGLMSVTFSYYMEESANNTKIVTLSKVDNRIQGDMLVDGKITVPENQTINTDLYVMSNNNFYSSYKLYYQSDNNVSVHSLNNIEGNIGPYDVQKVTLTLTNNESIPVSIPIGIENGYIDKEIIVKEKEITKK